MTRIEPSSHPSTVTRLEGSISHLEEELHSIMKALDDAKSKMEGMQSPQLMNALE